MTDLRVCVTGGAGYIGRNLVSRLAKDAARISVLDTVSFPFVIRVLYWRGSVVEADAVELATKGMDTVFHMAVLPHRVSMENPVEDMRVTVQGTLNILEAARKNDVKKVIFTSSAMVYGEPKKLPLREDMKCEPKIPYAVSKLAAEEYCRVYSELYGINAVVLRYTNVYGPGQTGPFLFPELMGRISRVEPITIYGDGNQTRDFVFIDDVTDANVAALGYKEKFGIFNIGLGTSTTVNKLVDLLYELSGYKEVSFYPRKIIHAPARPFEIVRLEVDISKARRELGWSPEVDLRTGVGRTWREFEGKTKT